jgi:protein tyrosine phosphatase (PTP) superfamily phosphohydrolase (DUF442 family)
VWTRSSEDKVLRRIARQKRWDRPLTKFPQRVYAWLHLLFADHGIFRLLYLNAHPITPQAWRAAQPAPHQLAAFAKKGVRTVVLLRGGREHGAWPLEVEACTRNGLELREYILRSRGAPSREEILNLPAFFRSLNHPVLFHCKSGADRAGLMATLYLLVHENRPLKEARRQLSLRYGHFRWAKTGILDAFFDLYEEAQQQSGSSLPFLTWVEQHYDPEQLEKTFHSSWWGNLFVDRVLGRE